MTAKIRVLLADDHQLMREGLRAILQADPAVEVCWEAANGHEAVELVEAHHPDIVLMDIGMPGLNGTDATRQVTRRCPRTRVIALSTYTDRGFVLSTFEAGACGYLVKDSATQELIKAIHEVSRGRKFISSAVAGTFVDGVLDKDFSADDLPVGQLGGREREVLQLLAEGKTSGEIAAAMHIATSTVETHRRNIMKKLDIHSVAELTKFAIRHGLTTA